MQPAQARRAVRADLLYARWAAAAGMPATGDGSSWFLRPAPSASKSGDETEALTPTHPPPHRPQTTI